jgi:tetratricopeptide (TPR) repeat protein
MEATWFGSIGYLDYLEGKYGAALKAAAHGRRLSEAIGNLWGVAYSLRVAGYVNFEMGRADRAIADMEECIRLGEQAGLVPVLVVTRSDLGFALAHQGRTSEGVALGRSAVATASGALAAWRAWPNAQLSRTMILARNLDGAAEALEAALAAAETQPGGLGWLNAWFARVELAAARADPESALRAADQLLERLVRVGVRSQQPEALRLRAEALAGLSRHAEAEVDRERARNLALEIGAGRVLALLGSQ